MSAIKAKKVTPQYRIGASNLVKAPNAVILMKFANGAAHTLLVEGIMAYMKADAEINGSASIARKMPEGVFLASTGAKIGAFPTIMALTENAAEIMTEYLGYPVVPGDGCRLATQNHAKDVFLDLKKLGAKSKELHCEWMISDPNKVVPSFDPCI